MGEDDENHTLQFDDAFSDSEKDLVRSVIGERMQPDRWQRSQDVYRAVVPDVTFRTYEGIGHGTDQMVNSEIVQFIEMSLGLTNVE